jgi:hypothetical protein
MAQVSWQHCGISNRVSGTAKEIRQTNRRTETARQHAQAQIKGAADPWENTLE